MKTRQEQMTQGGMDGDHNFLGDDSDYRDWYGILGRSRDSDLLEESNFETGLARLGGKGENVRVECYGHWAVGWIEEIYVRPKSPQFKIAEKIKKELNDYPVLDDEDYTQRCFNAGQCGYCGEMAGSPDMLDKNGDCENCAEKKVERS